MATSAEAGAEGGAGAGPMADDWLPVVDLADARTADGRARAVSQIRRACEDGGFFLLVGHGIAEGLVHGVRAATAELFGGPERNDPELAADPADPLLRGLVAGNIEPLEAFTVNSLGEPGAFAQLPDDVRPSLGLPNKWPRISGFAESYRSYMAATRELADAIMRLFAMALDLPEDWFAPHFKPDMSSLTVNFYPSSDARSGPDGKFLKIAHRDWGTLTILYLDEGATGLQVLGRDQVWREVPVIPGAFVINVGDLMALWTDNRWRSAVHRVVSPSTDRQARDRLSVAYFHQPSPAALIACVPGGGDPESGPQHRPQRADAYFESKRRQAYITERLMKSTGRTS
ncbi:isopenicillin N synthase family dioxygenase [Streptomyces sp. NPDC060184]|uniref:isopenicillin N synthase family dioxygenase n=1 Tax=Streptomyces sp. NPDC060184 TaxID=3347064 RepID=UPI003653EB03